MTVQELIENLMQFEMGAPVIFAELRYNGGGDEYTEDYDLDIWKSDTGIIFATPSCDTECVKYRESR